MSRKEARTLVRPQALARAMRRIAYPERLLRQLVEEAPAAYRDIGEVLDDQRDLVRRRIRLEPIAVLKG
jgi:tRNA-splicing ligase RtcB